MSLPTFRRVTQAIFAGNKQEVFHFGHYRRVIPVYPSTCSFNFHQRFFCSSESDGNSKSVYEYRNGLVVKYDPIEMHLSKFESMIGEDYKGYRGHIYRVFNFANILSPNLSDKDKELIGVALVYHDIGLWSDKVLAYIDPSCDFLMNNANKINKENNKNEYNENELLLMHHIVKYHHKITKYNPKDGKVLNEKYPSFVDIVDKVKDADIVDFSKGKITKGVEKDAIGQVLLTIPNDGFHDALNAKGPQFHGRNVFKIINEIRKIYYW